MKNYLKKNVVFNPTSERDMELYKALQALPYGDFTERTKALWEKELLHKEEQAKKVTLTMENDPNKVRNQLHRRFEGGKIGD